MTTTERSTRALIESCQGLVKAIAARVHSNTPPHIELDDLIGYGEIGVAEAAREFDPERGVRFSTFAYHRIRGAIYDGLSKMSWMNRAQYKRLRYEQMADEILRYGKEAARTESTPPTIQHDAQRFRRMTDQLFVVYLSTRAEGGDEGGEVSVEDPSAHTPEATAAMRECCDMIRKLIGSLAPDARALIRATYFEGLTLKEAADRFGKSKSWASRLHAKTLEQMAQRLRRLGLQY